MTFQRRRQQIARASAVMTSFVHALTCCTPDVHVFPVPAALEIPLKGPKGERVDLVRTIMSHGVADLPPGQVDEKAAAYTTTLALPSARPRTIRIVDGRPGFARIDVEGRKLGGTAARDLTAAVRQILNLDEDLSEFYALVANDPDLSWAARGAGRMVRTQTVFEAVVKTICTTNTAWSGTRKMTGALVDNLGVEAPGGARTFPTAEAMAEADELFYKEIVRAGYRGPYLKQLAMDVAEGRIDLEELNDPELPDDEAAARLLALPGVGPYAAAHVMLTSLGRYSRLVLDSWTRPTYGRLSGARGALKDATIERRFKRYGEWAGLAFWLYLTRGWVEDGLPV
jgi:3-methyladenine DNA glycosylase/8-oxoguanine DNA glycosylase